MERCVNGTQLRPYQLRGVQWLTQCLKKHTGCILGDEMGLGKTCQTLSLLVYMSEDRWKKGPFLVLSPVSVMENWRKELERFAPSLTVLCYHGDKERRAEIQSQMSPESFQVLLTSYEICLKDAEVLKRWRWKALVVDEAHRLKNQSTVLHRTLKQFTVSFRILLTGTPIQNNLEELYSLLTFIQPSNFPAEKTEDFVNTYSNVENDPALADELQCVLEPFLLRRVKSQVALDLPKKMELVMFHGLSALQKRYYKAFLMKDPEAFSENAKDGPNRLGNILMNLRKCVAHPYLFQGVEPEPFIVGEHLIEASGKLTLIDNILAHLHKGGHRVLLFSQMTRMLDILQDYMDFRGYTYERLDGSIQGQKRNLAVDNFSSNEIFAFLLSTKAGGVGLNLIAADTVIFVDTDFNPQNDLQASARCHRLGQNKPVKVIRLLARHTVEEITYARAVSKLRLTKAVIEGGRFALEDQVQSGVTALELSEILMFGVDKLLSSEESSMKDVKLEKILGRSHNGQWVDVEDLASLREEEEYSSSDSEIDHIYYFEGRDYSRKPSRRDSNKFNRMVKEKTNESRGTAVRGRGCRDDAEPSTSQSARTTRKRRTLAEDHESPTQNGTMQTRANRDRTQEDGKRKTLKHKDKSK